MLTESPKLLRSMNASMDKYKTILMDCDGVILDSNSIKSDAFYEVALPFGKDNAEKLVSINKQHGGVSRFKKMIMFINDVLGIDDNVLIDKLVKDFGDICVDKLIQSELTPYLIDFLKSMQDKDIFVVSGGYQPELKLVFEEKGLAKYFKGIYGSPETKDEISEMLRDDVIIDYPCVFIGDSKSDYYASKHIGADFIFMTEFSEFKGFEDFLESKDVKLIKNLGDIL